MTDREKIAMIKGQVDPVIRAALQNKLGLHAIFALIESLCELSSLGGMRRQDLLRKINKVYPVIRAKTHRELAALLKEQQDDTAGIPQEGRQEEGGSVASGISGEGGEPGTGSNNNIILSDS